MNKTVLFFLYLYDFLEFVLKENQKFLKKNLQEHLMTITKLGLEPRAFNSLAQNFSVSKQDFIPKCHTI
jgi:hypothetical protein